MITWNKLLINMYLIDLYYYKDGLNYLSNIGYNIYTYDLQIELFLYNLD